jgi:phosphohistidine phosphatase
MPTLLLMRHAKSDWGNALKDHDRPLNDRGKRDAPRMGRWLITQAMRPAWILTSSAKRARKTTDKVVEVLGSDVYVEVREDLYLATPEHWVEVLGELPAAADPLLCVGHNPGLDDLLNRLTGKSEHLSTAAIAWIDVPGRSWSEIEAPEPVCTLRALWRPRELPSEC